MNTLNDKIKQNYHYLSAKAYCRMLYSCSLKERVEIDLHILIVDVGINYSISKEETQTIEEPIEKPWWNDMYETIKVDRKYLEILYEMGCKIQDLKTLYKAVKSNNTELINSISKQLQIKNQIINNLGVIFNPVLIIIYSFFILLVWAVYEGIKSYII